MLIALLCNKKIAKLKFIVYKFLMKQIPNYLTILRILIVPAIIAAFYMQDVKLAGLVTTGLFLLAGITDFFDGAIARKLNAESDFGKMMDPIADKLLVGAVLVILFKAGRADLIPVMVILMREFLVSGYREFLAASGGKMPVTKLAKWKTTIQFLAILALLIIPATKQEYAADVFLTGQYMLWFAALLTFITGLQYTIHTIKFIRGTDDEPAVVVTKETRGKRVKERLTKISRK